MDKDTIIFISTVRGDGFFLSDWEVKDDHFTGHVMHSSVYGGVGELCTVFKCQIIFMMNYTKDRAKEVYDNLQKIQQQHVSDSRGFQKKQEEFLDTAKKSMGEGDEWRGD